MANPSLTINKSSNKTYVDIGTTVTYTVSLRNTGTAAATNVIITDLLPQGENFVNNSVYIDSVNSVGVNPALGIHLPTISIGQLSTVTFQSQVVNIPVSNPMSNTAQIDFQYLDPTVVVSSIVNTNAVLTTISSAPLTLNKTAPTIAALGGTITYNVRITNAGTTTATNVNIIDTIPAGTTFVPGSTKINSSPNPNSPAPPGINLTGFPAGYYVDLEFQVTVNSIPPSGSIVNFCDAVSTYVVDPSTTATTSQRYTSNITTSGIGAANLSSITLFSSTHYSACGDTIIFTVSVPNTGNLTALNVVISDTIPNGMVFVPNSVRINGVIAPGEDPESGISIGMIPPGQTSVVSFNVNVSC